MKKAIAGLLFSLVLLSSNLVKAENWHQIFQGRNFTKIVFADSMLGFVVSNAPDSDSWYKYYNDCIFKTIDGGKNWVICRDYRGDNISQYNFNLIFCQNTVYISSYLLGFDGNPVGPKIEYSSDLGGNWLHYDTYSLNSDLGVKIAVVDTQNIWANGYFIAKWNFIDNQWDSLSDLSLTGYDKGGIYFCDTLNGFISKGYFYKTSDGGYSWDTLTPPFAAGEFVCSGVENIWAISGSKIEYSSDTGNTWQEQNTGITSNINCIYALNDTALWAGADSGRFIYTKNGGSTWFKDSLSTTSRVNSIFFTGDSFGWVSTGDGILWGFGRAGLGVEGNRPEIAATMNKIFLQASPNPFRQNTTIAFEQTSRGPVNVSIYSITGQLVKTLVDGVKIPGKHQISWNGQDNSNQTVSQGAYICQMKSAKHLATKKIVLLR
jgi:hypothetical protein